MASKPAALDTLYKLIVLYMLNKSEEPLTKVQISDFIQDNNLTDYLTVQTTFSELIEDNLVESTASGKRTYLSITPEGRQTVSFFEKRINKDIRNDIIYYLNTNAITIRDENSVKGSYYKTTTGHYESSLVVRERNEDIVKITLSVPDEATAKSICDNWAEKSSEIYSNIVKNLF
ncbi:protein of unknown function [Lachnospiraceae bacterium G11]|nr:protein of unknown function [Lachnospiraceae bacterium G11]